MESPIIIALDGLSKSKAIAIVEKTHDLVWGYKVHELLIREGFGIIKELKPYGNVFIDLKFHDIPTTVEREALAVVSLGADLVSVHASGGSTMLESAVRAGKDRIVAITALSSFSENDVASIYDKTLETIVRESVIRASNAGVKNIVCSPREIALVKSINPSLTIITPGIRETQGSDDQTRTLSAREAVTRGADLLVIGRPITKAPDPRQALETILKTLE